MNNSVGIQSCPTPPCHSAARPASTRPGYVRVWDSTKRQISVGTLVSSQEPRALAVPLINRLSTAGFVPPSVYIGFHFFVLPKKRPGQCFRFAGKQNRGLSPCRITPTASRPRYPAPPSSPHRRAPPRRDRPVVCPVVWFDM